MASLSICSHGILSTGKPSHGCCILICKPSQGYSYNLSIWKQQKYFSCFKFSSLGYRYASSLYQYESNRSTFPVSNSALWGTGTPARSTNMKATEVLFLFQIQLFGAQVCQLTLPIWKQQKCFSCFKFSSLGHRYASSLFTNKKQKKVGSQCDVHGCMWCTCSWCHGLGLNQW